MTGGFGRGMVLAIAMIACAGSASAAVIGYTDRTSWEAALGSETIVMEDFEGVGSDTTFRDTTIDFGDFTIGEIGGAATSASVNLIDVSPFSFSGVNAIDGSAYALGWVNNLNATYPISQAAYVEFVFDDPVSAFAMDLNALVINIGLLFYVLPSGLDPTVSSNYVQCVACNGALANDFVGFTTTAGESFDRIVILPAVSDGSGSGQRFGMDNVSWVSAAGPEPSTAALLALGLTGLGVAGRRRH